MLPLFIQFAYLQALDLLTTVAFLLAGVKEANPLVNLAFALTNSALFGLLLVKAFGIGLGFLAYRSQRAQLLTRMNIAFALLVAWNMVALILGVART